MSTLADIRKAADGDVWVSDSGHGIPAGHFVAICHVLGISSTYLLAGATNDPTAPIVGRTEFNGHRLTAYWGAGIKGGVGRFSVTNSYEAFQWMLDGSDHCPTCGPAR